MQCTAILGRLLLTAPPPKGSEVVEDQFRQILFVFVGLVLAALLIGILLIAFGRDGEKVIVIPAGVREAFEAHLAALDAGDWELSDSFVKDECTISAAGDSEKALQEVIDGGFSYRRAFDIDDVWINEDGTEAILELQTPPELPDIAVLDLVDGEWLVAC